MISDIPAPISFGYPIGKAGQGLSFLVLNASASKDGLPNKVVVPSLGGGGGGVCLNVSGHTPPSFRRQIYVSII